MVSLQFELDAGRQDAWCKGRDVWYHRIVQEAAAWCPPVDQESSDPLFILYTSGTTGTPKGIVQGTGGYLTGVHVSTRWVFDLKDEDVFWCTADIGWVTGHSYVVYGPLANGATVVMYEGAPDWPDKNRFWDLCERHGVTVFYTAPTAIRAFMKWGAEFPNRHDLRRLRLLGSVGERINPDAWMWYPWNSRSSPTTGSTRPTTVHSSIPGTGLRPQCPRQNPYGRERQGIGFRVVKRKG